MKLILVNGFLGSGKTTAIVAACRQLMEMDKRVAVITNDQGEQQVDSAFVKSFGIPGREVSKGCFCCNYDQLDSHLSSLTEAGQPDFIFAESVGSCTDLIATIARPLGHFKPKIEVSISIFADAGLLAALLEGRSMFLDESIRYIYKKQLEEADLLVLNKTDLLTASELEAIDAVVKADYPNKIVLHQNSLDSDSIDLWINHLNTKKSSDNRHSILLDYDVYGEGESKLAWLDQSIEVFTDQGDAVLVTSRIVGSIFNKIQEHHLVIGHLKFFMESGGWNEKISFTTTSTRVGIKLRDHETNNVKLLINARVQTRPEVLARLIEETLLKAESTYACKILYGPLASFKPGYPVPKHRILN